VAWGVNIEKICGDFGLATTCTIYSNSPYLLMKISFNAVARPIYRKMVNASHPKYTDGRGARPIDEPKPVKGIAVRTAMPVNVNIMRGNEAWL
jgi:hypothetical protein